MLKCWSFVGKVYSIFTFQLLVTLGVGATFRLVPSISHFLLKTHADIAVSVVIILTPFVGMVISESVFFTAVAFVTLTLYTFWATWKGYDFSLLGPFLVEALLCLVVYVLIQAFFPLGKIYVMIFGVFGSIVFCGYIVYDTYLLIERHSEDSDYIFAAVSLYLDILNLFLFLIDLLGGSHDGCCVCCSAKCCECLGDFCECLGDCCECLA